MVKVSVIIPVYNQETLIERAVRSVPNRDDIEIIVIDDGSTDDTWCKLMMLRAEYWDKVNIVFLHSQENRGVAYAVNTGYDSASGEYMVLLGSDDYFLEDGFLKCMELLDGTDLVYYNLEVNDGSIWRLRQDNKTGLCGSVKFMRRAFVGDTRCPLDKKVGEDLEFYRELLKKNPTETFSDITVKHYNYPRKDSLTDLSKRGLI